MSSPVLAGLDTTAKEAVILDLFGVSAKGAAHRGFDQYLEYYDNEIKRLCKGFPPAWTSCLPSLHSRSHDDVLYIRRIVFDERSISRADLRHKLRQDARFQGNITTDCINRLVDLTVRLSLMINVRDEELPVIQPDAMRIVWDDAMSLDQLISTLFSCCPIDTNLRSQRLSPNFTAVDMVKICGLTLRWTASLADHLRLDRRSRTLWVFPYKDFLRGSLAVRESGLRCVLTFTLSTPQPDY